MRTPDLAALHSRIEIARADPALAGTFPKFPVLPGAVPLDEALQLIDREGGIELTRLHIVSAKFLDVVRPGDVLGLEHDIPKDGVIRFTLRCAGRTVASGSLT